MLLKLRDAANQSKDNDDMMQEDKPATSQDAVAVKSAHNEPDSIHGLPERWKESSAVTQLAVEVGEGSQRDSGGDVNMIMFETVIHVCLSKAVHGSVHAVIENALPEGIPGKKPVFELVRGVHEQHWMTPRLKMLDSKTEIQFFTPSRDGFVPLITGKSNIWKKSVELQNLAHNFLFPIDKTGFKVGLSPMGQTVAFVHYLAMRSSSEHMLHESILAFESIMNTVSVQAALREKRFGIADEILVGLAYIIGTLQPAQNADLQFPRLFMAIAGCCCIQTLNSKSVKSTEDAQDRFVFCAVLSCFSSFLVLSSESIDSLPKWALLALRGERYSTVSHLIRKSSVCSFQWICQIPGLLAACKSLDFLVRIFQPSWQGNRTATYGHSMPFIPRVPEFRSPGVNDLYIEAVNFALAQQRHTNIFQGVCNRSEADSDMGRMLMHLIIFIAPDFRSLFYLLCHKQFETLYLHTWDLSDGVCQKFKAFFANGKFDMIRDLWVLWGKTKAGAAQEGNGHAEGFVGHLGSASNTSTNMAKLTAVTTGLRKTLVSIARYAHNWPEESQTAYIDLVDDIRVFPGGLLEFEQEIRNTDSHNGRYCQAKILTTKIFSRMLPGALEADVDGSEIDNLLYLCDIWLRERPSKEREVINGLRIVDNLMESVPGLSAESAVAESVRDKFLNFCGNRLQNCRLLEASKYVRSIHNEKLLRCITDFIRDKIDKEPWLSNGSIVQWRKAWEVLQAIWVCQGDVALPPSGLIAQALSDITDMVIDAVAKAIPSSAHEGSSLYCTLQYIKHDGVLFWQHNLEVYSFVENAESIETQMHPFLEKLVNRVHEALQAVKQKNLTFQDAEMLLENESFNNFIGICVTLGFAADSIQTFEIDSGAFLAASTEVQSLQQCITDLKNELVRIENFVGVFCEQLEAPKLLQVSNKN